LIAAHRRETTTEPGAPAVSARAPAARAAASRTPTGPAPHSASNPAPDHLDQLQGALDIFSALPEPNVLADVVVRRQVDADGLLRQLTNTRQYITSFAHELDGRRR
jgi:hypothetical protein